MRFDITPISAPTLTGLTATPGLNSIVLQWDVPAASTEHAKTRVYMATSPSTGAAALIAEVSGSTYTHAGLSPTTRYYWVRSVNAYGREDGAYSSMVTIASTLVTALDIASAAVTAAKLSVAGIDASGQLIASQIAAGTIAAGVIYAGTVTAAQISASTLSAITANLGTITAGSITGTADINITGLARFEGANSFGGLTSALIVNGGSAAFTGIVAYGGGDAAIRGDGQSTSHGVMGGANGSGKAGIYALSTHASGYGAIVINNNGGTGLSVDTGTWSGSAFAIDCYGKFKLSNHAFVWNGYTIAPPAGGSDVLREDGTWGTAGTASYAGTAGEVNISGAANVTGTGNAALRASGGTHEAIMQTDGNFVVYNSGTPVGSSSGGFPSDARLKVKIAATKVCGADLVMALRVVDHGWAPGTPMHDRLGDQLQVGLIAQQVRKVMPGLVTEVADTLLLNKVELVPVLLKHNQELELRVRDLEQKVAELYAIICNK